MLEKLREQKFEKLARTRHKLRSEIDRTVRLKWKCADELQKPQLEWVVLKDAKKLAKVEHKLAKLTKKLQKEKS